MLECQVGCSILLMHQPIAMQERVKLSVLSISMANLLILAPRLATLASFVSVNYWMSVGSHNPQDLLVNIRCYENSTHAFLII